MAAVERLIDLYCRLLKVAIAACLAAMVVLVFTNVVMRYVFNSGIPTSEELSRWLMVWLTFLGAIVALREHAHLGIDTLVQALPAAGKRICFVVSYLLMIYADWLLLLGSWKQVVIGLGDRAPATRPALCRARLVEYGLPCTVARTVVFLVNRDQFPEPGAGARTGGVADAPGRLGAGEGPRRGAVETREFPARQRRSRGDAGPASRSGD
jgi:TRAP-type C4-dicarboxylate transport system permease small subunit